ncbi:MAG: hypothetical protein PHD01_16810 [Geobacteraceae bacterium]|nr:hypothetical protein [Geobacteraceae bacterium]
MIPFAKELGSLKLQNWGQVMIYKLLPLCDISNPDPILSPNAPSAAAHLTSAKDDLLQEPSWLEDAAKASYAEFILNNDEEAENRLRSATRTGRPFGSNAFIGTMETVLNATLRPRRPGRPSKYRGVSLILPFGRKISGGVLQKI